MCGYDKMYTQAIYTGSITNVLYGTTTANTLNTTTLNCLRKINNNEYTGKYNSTTTKFQSYWILF